MTYVSSNIILLIISVIACYLYAFVSGFTDAAQAIASAIGSRSLSPIAAVLMAGILEIVGALTGTAVAITIGKGIVALELISLLTVPAAIFGCLTWSLICYRFGIPVSETHGLIGGIIGAALGVSGTWKVIKWEGLLPILAAIVIAPLLGFLGGYFMMWLVYYFLHSAPSRVMNPLFKNLQRLAAAYLAFSHGRNDAQKPMGILAMALALYYGWKDVSVPTWVIISVGVTAGLGVACGGWRIVKTLGMRITPLAPEQGFISDFAAANVMQLASLLGIPISTTHVDASAVFGVGAARRFSAVRWGVVRDIFASWVITLPATIATGWVFVKLLDLFL